MTTFALTLVLGLAFAQEPGDEPPADETAVSADRPLAIPREPAPAPPSAPRAAEPAPVDAAKLVAFRAYRSRHLSVRHYSGVAMGTVVAGGYGYGFGYGYGAMQTAYPYYYPVQGWGVFQGPVRLQTLDYLGLVQDVG